MRSYFGIMLLWVFIVAAVAVGNSPVSAATCTIQASSLAYTAPNFNYYTSGVIVPVSATCPFIGGHLYAVGYAADTSTNARVGSAPPVALSSAYGSNIYTGQLIFSLPPEATGHALQISVSIYSGVYYGYSNASPLATSVETVQVNSNNYYANYASCYYNNNCAPFYNSGTSNSLVQCNSPGNNNTMQCSGYLYQNSNACVILVIPVYSSIGLLSYQYYTLQKLPSSYPALGTWVSVTGQLHQGSNFSSTGAACPGNYLNVTSISS